MKITINHIAFLYTIWLALANINCKFIKFGPCIFGFQPTCPDPHINFYLYTRKNVDEAQKVFPDKDHILQSNFEPENANKVIIHGYNSDMNLGQLLEIKQGYLKTGDFNIWMVDWNIIAAGPCYPVVVSNLNYVGKCIAGLLLEILNVSVVPDEDKSFHIIGFSMGAHLAAFVANNLRPYKVSRITGLDPALPLFTTPVNDFKLDKTDAEFVDVLHTDALIEGKVERTGHIDFYLNGGLDQPGCWNGNLIESLRCNHHRAPSYFAESITSEIGFWGWSCKGFFHYITNKCPPKTPDTLMGEHCNNKSSGYYIIHTAAKRPFAIGRDYIIQNSTSIIVPQRNNSEENGIGLIILPTISVVEQIKNYSYFSINNFEYNVDLDNA